MLTFLIRHGDAMSFEKERLLGSHIFSRNIALVLAIILGTVFGVSNYHYPIINIVLDWKLILLLPVSAIAVIIMHEGVHGNIARLLGHKPIYGIKLPFVYVTFDAKIPREHFIAVALAPFILLNITFVIVFISGHFKLFMYLSFLINTLGAIGDLWMTYKLLPYDKGVMVQDTKTGFQVWGQAD